MSICHDKDDSDFTIKTKIKVMQSMPPPLTLPIRKKQAGLDHPPDLVVSLVSQYACVHHIESLGLRSFNHESPPGEEQVVANELEPGRERFGCTTINKTKRTFELVRMCMTSKSGQRLNLPSSFSNMVLSSDSVTYRASLTSLGLMSRSTSLVAKRI